MIIVILVQIVLIVVRRLEAYIYFQHSPLVLLFKSMTIQRKQCKFKLMISLFNFLQGLKLEHVLQSPRGPLCMCKLPLSLK
jgi:hypothetical protein